MGCNARKTNNKQLDQNYCQSGEVFSSPEKRVVNGYPVSGLAAKIFLEMYENLLVNSIPKDHTFIFYNRYVESILLIHDNTKINPEHISTRMNKLHKNVQFKLMAGNDTRSYWDFNIRYCTFY
jgi:hypothetical protein